MITPAFIAPKSFEQIRFFGQLLSFYVGWWVGWWQRQCINQEWDDARRAKWEERAKILDSKNPEPNPFEKWVTDFNRP